jgi:hypothetical protein
MAQPGLDAAPLLEAPKLEAWLDADGRLVADVGCLQCGYNLRSLRADATCPECGAPVKPSIERWLSGDPRWLKRLICGLDLILLGPVLLPVVGLFVALMTAAIQTLLSLPRDPRTWIGTTAWLAAMSPTILIAWGIWKFTSPEPGTSGLEHWKTRLTVRIAGLTSCVLLLFAVPIFSQANDIMTSVALFSGCLAVTVFGSAVHFYGGRLARRLGSRTLTWCMFVVAAGYALLAAGVGIAAAVVLLVMKSYLAIAPWTFAHPPPPLPELGIALWLMLAAATGLATLGVAVAYRVYLARQLRLALERAAEEAWKWPKRPR